MTWGADETTLAFNWYIAQNPGNPRLDPTQGLRLLDTAAPGSRLVADSRLAVPVSSLTGSTPGVKGIVVNNNLMLTPDCTTVAGAIRSPHFNRQIHFGFAEYSAATGHLTRKLDWGPAGNVQDGNTYVLWTNGTGSTLVVYEPPGHATRIAILRDGQLTLLPRLPRFAKVLLPVW